MVPSVADRPLCTIKSTQSRLLQVACVTSERCRLSAVAPYTRMVTIFFDASSHLSDTDPCTYNSCWLCAGVWLRFLVPEKTWILIAGSISLAELLIDIERRYHQRGGCSSLSVSISLHVQQLLTCILCMLRCTKECTICREDFQQGEQLRVLPCLHKDVPILAECVGTL